MKDEFKVMLLVGWPITKEQIKAKFGKDVCAITHQERRWDPKTGEEVAPEVVVDQRAGIQLWFGGKRFMDVATMAGHMADTIGCRAVSWTDDGGDEVVVFGPHLGDDFDGTHAPFGRLSRAAVDVVKIGKALDEMGFKTSRIVPIVAAVKSRA